MRTRAGRLISLGRGHSGSGGGGDSSAAGGTGGPRGARSPSGEMLISGRSNSEDSEEILGGETKMEEELPSSRSTRTNSRTQASVEKLDRLDLEMDRVSAGVNLLQQSVEKLQDAVAASKQGPTFLRLLRECFNLLRRRESSTYSVLGQEDHPVSPERIPRRSSRGSVEGIGERSNADMV